MADIIVELMPRARLGWLTVATLDRASDCSGTAVLNNDKRDRTMVPSHAAVSCGGGGALKPFLTSGWPNIIVALLAGSILAIFFQRRRDFLANMIGHFLVDFVGAVFPRFFS